MVDFKDKQIVEAEAYKLDDTDEVKACLANVITECTYVLANLGAGILMEASFKPRLRQAMINLASAKRHIAP